MVIGIIIVMLQQQGHATHNSKHSGFDQLDTSIGKYQMKTNEKLARAMCNNILGTDALWSNFVPIVSSVSSSVISEIDTDEILAAAVEAYQEASEKIASKEGMRAALKAIKEKIEEQ